MKTEAIREALAFMRRAGIDGSMGFVLSEAEKELNAVDAGVSRTALRDTFAAAALTGILAAKHGGWDGPEDDAKKAYLFSDAMLKAREGK